MMSRHFPGTISLLLFGFVAPPRALPPPMASLSAGVLLKLLRGVEFPCYDLPLPEIFSGCDGSAVLQAMGIIYALAGFELFCRPSGVGFFSLHLLFDDVILSDSLQLGLLIHVHLLEPSSHVPVLHGLLILPGSHTFLHATTSVPTTMPSSCSTKCQLMDSSP